MARLVYSQAELEHNKAWFGLFAVQEPPTGRWWDSALKTSWSAFKLAHTPKS